MTTAFDVYVPFDAGDGQYVHQRDWEAMMTDLGLTTGVLRSTLNECAVSADGTSMDVTVDTGQVWMDGHLGEISAAKTLTLSVNLDPYEYSRIDTVVIYLDYLSRTMGLDVIEGTPAATPSAGSTGYPTYRYNMPIAYVNVDYNSWIAVGDVSDARRWSVPQNGAGGIILAGTVDADAVVSVTTEATIPGWSFPLWFVGGRRYRFRAVFRPDLSVTTAAPVYRLYADDFGTAVPTLLTEVKARTYDGSAATYLQVEVETDSGSSELNTVYLTAQTGGGTLTIVGRTNAEAANSAVMVPWLTVEDLGPAVHTI